MGNARDALGGLLLGVSPLALLIWQALNDVLELLRIYRTCSGPYGVLLFHEFL